MSIKAEEIRQAKKFLENKKLSIKKVKPRLFAIEEISAGMSVTKLPPIGLVSGLISIAPP